MAQAALPRGRPVRSFNREFHSDEIRRADANRTLYLKKVVSFQAASKRLSNFREAEATRRIETEIQITYTADDNYADAFFVGRKNPSLLGAEGGFDQPGDRCCLRWRSSPA